MTNLRFSIILLLTMMVMPLFMRAQSPNLRSLSSFVFFTTTGAISNAGTSFVTGDVGTGTGAVTGLGAPTVVTGTTYLSDSVTTQATVDLNYLYNELHAAVPNVVHAAVFGGGETLLPGVYYTGGAGSTVGTLNLNAAGNTNALFIIKFNGAFSAGDVSVINLMNGAKACNVFWVAEGAIATGANTHMKGTLLANNAAVSMAAGGQLEGRLLSTTGAIAVSTGNFTVTTGCITCQQPPGTSRWLGGDHNWKNINNWCGGVPLLTTNVIIPSSLTYYPIITNDTANFHHLIIDSGASISVSGTGVCNLYGVLTNAGMLDITDGTLNLAGANLIISGNSLLHGTVKNLTISCGGATAIATGVSNMLNIKNNLSFLTSYNVFTTNGNLTLLSDATSSASVTDLTNNGTLMGNSISGNAYVERFIPSLKRWRYLAINTEAGTGSKNTIQANWMEGQAPGVNGGGSGKGLWITDAGFTSTPGNFDASSFTPSMKWYNGSSYTGIGNPIDYDIRSHAAYFTYIRGDRGSTASNGILSTTVLRTFGNLSQGDKMTTIPAGINGIGTGNPYASAIDLRKVFFSTNDVINLYVWDPNIGGGGSYGQGGFQLLSRDPKVDADFTIVPGSGSYGEQSIMNTIESGLGFFIQGSLTNRNLTFKETSKTTVLNNPFRTSGLQQKVQGSLAVRNANDSLTMLDVFQVRMAANYNTGLDANDARKRLSSMENVASNREGTMLALEYRNSTMSINDSLIINCTNLHAKNYCWTFSLSSLTEPGRTGILVDKYLETETVLNLDSITNYNFTVTAAAASFNVNRFLIIFRHTAVIPIEIIKLSATNLPNGIVSLKWTVQNEINTDHYETEKSTDGHQFLPFGTNIVSTNNIGGDAVYSKADATVYTGDNYYRIKAAHNHMHLTYSEIVKIKSVDGKSSVDIYPDPVTNKTIQLYLKGMPLGMYAYSLTDAGGRKVLNGSVMVDAAVLKKEIIMKNAVSGNYQLEISNTHGFKKMMSIIVAN